MTEAYEGELEWLRSKIRELDALHVENERLRNDYSVLKSDYDALREEWNELVQVAREARRAREQKP